MGRHLYKNIIYFNISRMASNTEKENLFLKFKYDKLFIKETLSNNALSTNLYNVLIDSSLNDCEKPTANLLREIASKKQNLEAAERSLIIKYTSEKKIMTKEQLEAAYTYFKDKKDINNIESFDKTCGVGIIITEEIIDNYIN